MTEPAAEGTRGRPVGALIGVAWVGLGFWSIKDERMWHGAFGVALGLLFLATYLWPGSRIDRFLSAPLVRRKRPADR